MPAPTELTLDLVVPVPSAAPGLDRAIRTLHERLEATMKTSWEITIADAVPGTEAGQVADRLAHDLDHVRVVHLELPGRGHAIKVAWLLSEADVLGALDLEAAADAPEMSALIDGSSDVLLGTVHADGERLVVGMRRAIARRVLPDVVDRDWFFDTELRVLAERAGLRVGLVPPLPQVA